jgi:hypothetical protein
MHKKVMLLLICILFTGCSYKAIDNQDLNKIVDTVVSSSTRLTSVSSTGYDYYLPKGVINIDNTNYNEKLSSNGNTYYLYVDIASYYYKKSETYNINNNAYFSKVIDINGKKGYLEINKIDNQYFIEMMYNYAKIEALVVKQDIPDTVTNVSYILASLKFNKAVIKVLFENNMLKADEEKFQIFIPKGKVDNKLEIGSDNTENTQRDEDVISPITDENIIE